MLRHYILSLLMSHKCHIFLPFHTAQGVLKLFPEESGQLLIKKKTTTVLESEKLKKTEGLTPDLIGLAPMPLHHVTLPESATSLPS